MLFLLSFYFATLGRTPTTASPVPIWDIRLDYALPRASPDSEAAVGACFDKNYRSAADITWTCWLAIFACTWVSVHPNVCGYQSTTKDRLLQRVELMLWALMAPEVIVMWAFKQWRGAREIRDNIWEILGYNEPRVGWLTILQFWKRGQKYGSPGDSSPKPTWTLTHSHFFQMGGYMYKKDGAIQYLNAWGYMHDQTLQKEAQNAIIRRPGTEEELNDRSKGDALAKTFVILQTLWFIIQTDPNVVEGCSQSMFGLAIDDNVLKALQTHYAALNGMMYYFWWNKPLNVQCPIVISLTSTPKDPPLTEEVGGDTGPTSSAPTVDNIDTAKETKWSFTTVAKDTLTTLTTLYYFLCFPMRFLGRLREIAETDMFGSSQRQELPQGRKLLFPTFYAQYVHGGPESGFLCGSLLASVFGAIHCIAWSFPLPSPTTQMLWRVSALFICLSPWFPIIIFPAIAWLADCFDDFPFNLFIKFMFFLAYVLYIPARFILIYICLSELRHLRDAAHRTIEWLDFFPHV